MVPAANPEILLKRLKDKKYGREKIKENLMAEILDYNLINATEKHDKNKVFEILNENVDETVSEIIDVVKNPKKRISFSKSKCNFLTRKNLDLIDSI